MHQLAKPAKEPVSVEEVFADRRLTTPDEFNLVKRLISAAREECENITRRVIASRQFEFTIDDFDGDILLVPPVVSVTHVKYYNTSDVLNTVNSSLYRLVGANGVNPRIVVIDDWPTDVRDFPESAVITATLGYADGACPEGIRSWIISRVGTMFEFREQLISGTIIAELPYINALLDPYIIAGAYARG
jgi:uncharacterized phiE125 gp8 family phage protein